MGWVENVSKIYIIKYISVKLGCFCAELSFFLSQNEHSKKEIYQRKDEQNLAGEQYTGTDPCWSQHCQHVWVGDY